MEKIEKLYQTIQNLQELGLSLPEDVLKKITDLEEKIIRDDILPIIKQDIEPTLRIIAGLRYLKASVKARSTTQKDMVWQNLMKTATV